MTNLNDNITPTAVATVLKWASMEWSSTEIPAINGSDADASFLRNYVDLLQASENNDAWSTKFQAQMMIETMIATVTTAEDGYSDEDVEWSDDCEKVFNIIDAL